ncbi:MAG: hypothetical protein E7394_08800 [Ruminococcaceae bacterium]|nr:hypothetical protein [Oscillospiraceae bacterium]
MFDSKKKVPDTLEECYVTDEISYNLWTWAERVELWGKKMAFVLIAIGLTTVVIQILQMAEEYYDEVIVFTSVAVHIFKWGIYVFLEYCAYHMLALLIASLATIVQNTNITSNIALYKEAKGNFKNADTQNVTAEKKDFCGNKAESGYSLLKMAKERNEEDGYWICKSCGRKNNINVYYCNDCGNHK